MLPGIGDVFEGPFLEAAVAGARPGNAGGEAGFGFEPLEPGHGAGFALIAQFNLADMVAVGPYVAGVGDGAAVDQEIAQQQDMPLAGVLHQFAFEVGDGLFGRQATGTDQHFFENVLRQDDSGHRVHILSFPWFTHKKTPRWGTCRQRQDTYRRILYVYCMYMRKSRLNAQQFAQLVGDGAHRIDESQVIDQGGFEVALVVDVVADVFAANPLPHQHQ